MAKKQKYTVYVDVKLDLGIYVNATSLEDALEQARALKPTDIVDLDAHEHNDSSTEVRGVFVS